ncbi:MAG: hypothetical protein IIU91_07225, partial [Alistipes sp.]|nr:hypothetical protein [Alistipes sp.]
MCINESAKALICLAQAMRDGSVNRSPPMREGRCTTIMLNGLLCKIPFTQRMSLVGEVVWAAKARASFSWKWSLRKIRATSIPRLSGESR